MSKHGFPNDVWTFFSTRHRLYVYVPTLQRAEVKLKSGWTFMLNHYVTPLRKGKTRIFLKTARNFIKQVRCVCCGCALQFAFQALAAPAVREVSRKRCSSAWPSGLPSPSTLLEPARPTLFIYT